MNTLSIRRIRKKLCTRPLATGLSILWICAAPGMFLWRWLVERTKVMVRMQVTGVVTTFLTWQVAHGLCEWQASARQTIDLIDLGEKAIAVRKALPRPLTLIMMASLLMEEGALNKFQYIGMVAFLGMRLCDYHHRYLCKPLSIMLCVLWTIHLPAAPVFCCLVYLLPSFPLCDAKISATEKALDISQDAGQSVRSVIDNII
jgi:hypothetical protein